MSLTSCPRVALIGVSGYAQVYLQLARAAHARGELRLVAAVIINPAEAATIEAQLRQDGCRIYRDYEVMLQHEAGQLELCLIPTGIPWHARMTLAALRAGAHVLVEKPLAGSLAEVTAIREAEQVSNRFVAVGFQDLYSPVNRWLKDQLCAGAIGRVHTVRFLGMWPRPATYFTRNPWAGRLFADGTQVLDSPLNNAFAHFVNLGLYFAGNTPQTSASPEIASAELLRANAIESFDTSVVRAHSVDGINFWFGATLTCHEVREPEIYLEGTGGHVVWQHERNCTLVSPGKAAVEKALPDITANRQAMFTAVLAKLRDPATIVCTTAQAEPHTRFVEAVHAATTVQTVPPTLIRWTMPAPAAPAIPVVHGLEAALVAAFKSHSLLSDQGFTLTPAP